MYYEDGVLDDDDTEDTYEITFYKDGLLNVDSEQQMYEYTLSGRRRTLLTFKEDVYQITIIFVFIIPAI